MRIAIVDVAAESGGALSVLMDFLKFLDSINTDNNDYYIFVSQKIKIHNPKFHYIVKNEIKKSWLNRLKWELFEAKNDFKKFKIDVIISFQNTGFFFKDFKQIVYFHNVLLLEDKWKYSLIKKEERKFAVYTKLIAPYTLTSLKYADIIISQTNTVKKQLLERIPDSNILVINPNVYVEPYYINTASTQIKGFIYPTSAVPFKRIEEIIKCAKKYHKWFIDNKLEILITIDGSENEYAKRIKEYGKPLKFVKFIGYQSRDAILRFYQDHALIINSELESYPLPFKEAEMVGTSIISADYPYAVEVLSYNTNAHIFHKHDIIDMLKKSKEAVNIKKANAYPKKLNTWEEVYETINKITFNATSKKTEF